MRLYPSDEYTGVMLEIPIPAGMLLPSIDSVSCNYSDTKKEFNPKLKTVSIFFHSISSGHTVNVDVKLEPCTSSCCFQVRLPTSLQLSAAT